MEESEGLSDWPIPYTQTDRQTKSCGVSVTRLTVAEGWGVLEVPRGGARWGSLGCFRKHQSHIMQRDELGRVH